VVDPGTDNVGGADVVFLAAVAKRRSGRKIHHTSWLRPARIAEPAVEPTTVALHVAAERQRIASALHDDVSSLLFAIAAEVQRAEILHSDDVDELRRTIFHVGEQVLEASDRLRKVLRSATPVEPAEGVPTAAQRDLDDLAERSRISTHLIVRGVVRALAADVERAGLNCLRQALFNIERHARAHTVIVTLSYSLEEFVLVVQDDGQGLPGGYEPRVVPEAGHHWGFVSMARQVEQRGGELELTGVEEGGTRLRMRLPICP
jgi:signal transduction histidine kinase